MPRPHPATRAMIATVTGAGGSDEDEEAASSMDGDEDAASVVSEGDCKSSI